MIEQQQILTWAGLKKPALFFLGVMMSFIIPMKAFSLDATAPKNFNGKHLNKGNANVPNDADFSEKIEDLLLHKKKAQALGMLAQKAKEDGAKFKYFEIYRKISKQFETDRAQQLYELALTAKRADLSQALKKIDEALLIEPSNIELRLEQVRIYLGKKDCARAKDLLAPMIEKYSFDENVNLTQAYTLYCLNELTPALLAKLKKDSSVVPILKETFWESLGILLDLRLSIEAPKDDVLISLKKNQMDYPELFYLDWKISQKRKGMKISYAQKYISRCREITGVLWRKYNDDPFLCIHATDVEEELRSLHDKESTK